MALKIISSCPGKIIAFGEWSVLTGHPGIGISVRPRFWLEATIDPHKKNKTDKRYTHFKFESCWIKKNLKFQTDFQIDSEKKISQIINTAPESWHFFLKAFFHLFDFEILKSLRLSKFEINLKCDWHPLEGLGSSSALVACLLGLREKLLNKKRIHIQNKLFLEGREIIQNLQKGPASGLDLATQLWGGAVLVKNNKAKKLRLKSSPRSLVVVHTYKKFNTAKLVRKFNKSSIFLNIPKFTRKFLRSKKLEKDWIEAISKHFETFKNHPQLVPTKLRVEMETWLAQGYFSSIKTTGAGGGDALMGTLTTAKLGNFRKILKKRGYTLRSSTSLFTKGLTVKRYKI